MYVSSLKHTDRVDSISSQQKNVSPLPARAMADQVAKGEEFEKKAEKKLKGWGIFGSKYDDAAELYDKASNCYKLAKSCKPFSAFFEIICCRSLNFL